jgi:hypothetical protein
MHYHKIEGYLGTSRLSLRYRKHQARFYLQNAIWHHVSRGILQLFQAVFCQ